MKNYYLLILSIVILKAYSQEKLNLNQAINIAMENSFELKKINLDKQIADKKILETTSRGLPQAQIDASYQNMIKLPVTLIPAKMFNPNASDDEFQEVSFGTKHNSKMDFTVNQLIFSGAYFVGLQTSKTYKKISDNNYEINKLNIKENVIKSYFGVLVSEKSKEILGEIDKSTKELLESSQKLKDLGLIDIDNLNQIKLNYLSINKSYNSMDKQIDNAKNYLKYQMGIDLDKEIILSEDIETYANTLNYDTSSNINISDNVNYQMLETNIQLQTLNIKYQKSLVLPTLTAFYQYSISANRNEFNFFKDLPWYKSNILGLNLSIPLLSGMSRKVNIDLAKLEKQKSEIDMNNLLKGIDLQLSNAKIEYNKAIDEYKAEKEKLVLNQQIFENYKSKYKQGILNSLDITQIQIQYNQAQANYISSIMTLINAKIELDKIKNKL